MLFTLSFPLILIDENNTIFHPSFLSLFQGPAGKVGDPGLPGESGKKVE